MSSLFSNLNSIFHIIFLTIIYRTTHSLYLFFTVFPTNYFYSTHLFLYYRMKRVWPMYLIWEYLTLISILLIVKNYEKTKNITHVLSSAKTTFTSLKFKRSKIYNLIIYNGKLISNTSSITQTHQIFYLTNPLIWLFIMKPFSFWDPQ